MEAGVRSSRRHRTGVSWEGWPALDTGCVSVLASSGVPPREPRGRSGARPAYGLRHSFASMLLHEGRSVMYVARQLGHDARQTLTRYGHVIDELEDAPRLEAEVAIANGRLAVRTNDLPSMREFGQ